MAKGATIGGSVSVGGRAVSSFGSTGKSIKSSGGIDGARFAGGRPESGGGGGMPKDGASYSFADALRSAGINKTKSGPTNTYNPFTSQELGSGVQLQTGKGSKPEVGNIGRRDVLQRRVMPQGLRNAPEFNPAIPTRPNNALRPEVSLPPGRSIDSLKINAPRVVEKQLGQNALDGKSAQHAGNTKSQEAALLGQIREAYDSKSPNAAKYEVSLIKKPATDVPVKSLEFKPRPDIKVNSRKPEVSLVKSEDSNPANGDLPTSSFTGIDAVRSALGREADRQFSVSAGGVARIEQRVQTAAGTVESSGDAPQAAKVTSILDRLKEDKEDLRKKVFLIKSAKHLELRDQLQLKAKGKAPEASASVHALSLLHRRIIQKNIVEKDAEEIVEKVSLKKKVDVKADELKTKAVSLLKRTFTADAPSAQPGAKAEPIKSIPESTIGLATVTQLHAAASDLESAALKVEGSNKKAQVLAPVIQLRRQAAASEVSNTQEQSVGHATPLTQPAAAEQPLAQVINVADKRAEAKTAAQPSASEQPQNSGNVVYLQDGINKPEDKTPPKPEIEPDPEPEDEEPNQTPYSEAEKEIAERVSLANKAIVAASFENEANTSINGTQVVRYLPNRSTRETTSPIVDQGYDITDVDWKKEVARIKDAQPIVVFDYAYRIIKGDPPVRYGKDKVVPKKQVVRVFGSQKEARGRSAADKIAA